MDQELDHFLTKRFPGIFRERNHSVNESCMAWGYACGNGWFKILYNACSLIEGHINHLYEENKRKAKWLKEVESGEVVTDWIRAEYEKGNLIQKPVPEFYATQIKEKFGTLRFYYDGGDDYISGIVSFAEVMSGSICEECGAPGTLGGRGYVSTKCESHKAKKNEFIEEALKVDDIIAVLISGRLLEVKITEVVSQVEIKGVVSEMFPKNNLEGTEIYAKLVSHETLSYWDAQNKIN